jgi:RNA polymerase sigma-70 factor (ECF subfamily)
MAENHSAELLPMRLRAKMPVPVADPLPPSGPIDLFDPARLMEDRATRDWLWHGIEQLSEPLRLVTLLRYFTGVTSYEQIAGICCVPVGTVRSRLSKARATLARRLAQNVDWPVERPHGISMCQRSRMPSRTRNSTPCPIPGCSGWCSWRC